MKLTLVVLSKTKRIKIVSWIIYKSYVCFLEKNPFTQRRSTAGQTGNKSGETYPEAQNDPSKVEDNEEEESDDFDEFYNDKGFLNTGMNRAYEPMFGGMQA